MLGKGSKLYSIIGMKCPKCHEGDMFKTKSAYDLKNISAIYDRCPVCNQNYHPEPNFYYGAMYVSYAYTVALFVAVFIVSFGFFDLGVWTTVSILTGLLVLLSPYLFRLSRSTYLSFFVGYDKEAVKKYKAQQNA